MLSLNAKGIRLDAGLLNGVDQGIARDGMIVGIMRGRDRACAAFHTARFAN